MGNPITPSDETMTDGQIEKATDIFRNTLRKHRKEFGTKPVQDVLGLRTLGTDLLAPFRKCVEAVSNLIVRVVQVVRSRTPQEALDATGRAQYTDKPVVAAMPKGEGEQAEVVFFNLGRYVSDDDLEKEYEARGLKPADPYSLAAVNEADPAFADEKPNSTHWKDSEGKWCYAAFYRGVGERGLSVRRGDRGWVDSWWFAGVRK